MGKDVPHRPGARTSLVYGRQLSREAQGPDPGRRGGQACGDREKQGPCTCPPPLIPPPPNPPKNLLEPVPTADTRPHPQRV